MTLGPIRVAIADDHEIVRQGVRSFLHAQPGLRVVFDTASGRELLQRLPQEPVDVVVLDLSMEGTSGLDVLAALGAWEQPPAVVVFSMYPEDAMAHHLLSVGAAAYLSKSRSPDELLRAIRAVVRHGRYVTETIEDLAVQRGPAPAPARPHDALTAREYQVFLALIAGRSVSAIAADLDLSPSTVSNHVASIRTKLGAETIVEIVLYAHRAGLL